MIFKSCSDNQLNKIICSNNHLNIKNCTKNSIWFNIKSGIQYWLSIFTSYENVVLFQDHNFNSSHQDHINWISFHRWREHAHIHLFNACIFGSTKSEFLMFFIYNISAITHISIIVKFTCLQFFHIVKFLKISGPKEFLCGLLAFSKTRRLGISNWLCTTWAILAFLSWTRFETPEKN